jgi:hypothetical protein
MTSSLVSGQGQSQLYQHLVIYVLLVTIFKLNVIYFQECIPALIDFACSESSPESVQLAALQALTNLSMQPDLHPPYARLVQALYAYLDSPTHTLTLQALRVLVNLSCNPVMVPHLLAAKVCNQIFSFF